MLNFPGVGDSALQHALISGSVELGMRGSVIGLKDVPGVVPLKKMD